jgi:hypothetical protein
VGIDVLRELNLKANFGFFDSWHTLDHLLAEITCFENVAASSFYIALDDAYYDQRHQNYAYVNMIRRKLGISPVIEPESNRGKPFHLEIDGYLRKKYLNVVKIEDAYKKLYVGDIFFDYYEADRLSMNRVGMEKKDQLEHRFDAWRVVIENVLVFFA